MTGLWNVTAIGETFVEAAIDPGRWPAALELIGVATASQGAALVPIDRRHRDRLAVTRSLEGARAAYIEQEWKLRDVRDGALPLLAHRGVITDHDLPDFERVRRSPYYREFLASNDLAWFAGLKFGADAGSWCVCIQRTNLQGPFSPSEIAMLGAIARRMESAAALMQALDVARIETAAQAFELSGLAVVMLDRSGVVVKANAIAERLPPDGLQITRGRIIATSASAQAEFDRALHRLVLQPASAPLTMPIAFPRAGRHPLVVHAIRLSNPARDLIGGFHVAVVIVDTDRPTSTSGLALEVAFGLTKSEARLAVRVADGTPLKQIATDLGVAYETSRAQLKSVFGKTSVRRQAELVALIGRLPAPVP